MANIEEYASGPMPDWVKVGEDVAVVYGRSFDQQVSIEKVNHVTPTQVTVGHSKYNLKRNLKRIGHTDQWSRPAFLADPQDPQVRLALIERNVRNAKYLVAKFSDEFAKNSTFESANEIVKAVAIWRQWSNRLHEFTESVKAEA